MAFNFMYLRIIIILTLAMQAFLYDHGILYDGYSKKFWYWEITVVLRKLAIILIGEFLDGQNQILSMLLVLFVVMYVTATCQPFENVELLRLELASLAVCFITFWIGTMFLEESSICRDGSFFVCQAGAIVIVSFQEIVDIEKGQSYPLFVTSQA